MYQQTKDLFVRSSTNCCFTTYCIHAYYNCVVLQHTVRLATNSNQYVVGTKRCWANNSHRDSSCTTQDIASPSNSIGQLVEIALRSRKPKKESWKSNWCILRTDWYSAVGVWKSYWTPFKVKTYSAAVPDNALAVSGKLYDTQLWRHTCARNKRNTGSLQHWRWQKC